jgi:hypothetical protein
MSSTVSASLAEVALLRLAAQRLVGPGCATPLETVRWLGAVQAQDYPGALTSVALRTASCTTTDVVTALDAGELARSWPMRGTLHLVAAEDLPWMLRVLATRVVDTTARRRAGLGLTAAHVDRARDVAVSALRGGGRLRRRDLFRLWDAAGLSTPDQRGAHLLGLLAMTGTLTFGPTSSGEPLLVLVDEWIATPRELDDEEALGELAERYFRSHGPASVADFTRWTKLRAADVRAGLALARPRLVTIEVDGVEHLMDPGTPEVLAAARRQAEGVALLPGFDELMLGYGDRRASLDPVFADRIVPGGNGVFRPTVVSAGRVIGTWSRTGRPAGSGITATPFTSFPPEVSARIAERYAALP